MEVYQMDQDFARDFASDKDKSRLVGSLVPQAVEDAGNAMTDMKLAFKLILACIDLMKSIKATSKDACKAYSQIEESLDKLESAFASAAKDLQEVESAFSSAINAVIEFGRIARAHLDAEEMLVLEEEND